MSNRIVRLHAADWELCGKSVDGALVLSQLLWRQRESGAPVRISVRTLAEEMPKPMTRNQASKALKLAEKLRVASRIRGRGPEPDGWTVDADKVDEARKKDENYVPLRKSDVDMVCNIGAQAASWKVAAVLVKSRTLDTRHPASIAAHMPFIGRRSVERICRALVAFAGLVPGKLRDFAQKQGKIDRCFYESCRRFSERSCDERVTVACDERVTVKRREGDSKRREGDSKNDERVTVNGDFEAARVIKELREKKEEGEESDACEVAGTSEDERPGESNNESPQENSEDEEVEESAFVRRMNERMLKWTRSGEPT